MGGSDARRAWNSFILSDRLFLKSGLLMVSMYLLLLFVHTG